MSCDWLQSRSAQIAFTVSSSVFGNRKAVGQLRLCVMECSQIFSLLVSDEIRKVWSVGWAARVLAVLQRSKCSPGWQCVGIHHGLKSFKFVDFSCGIYTGRMSVEPSDTVGDRAVTSDSHLVSWRSFSVGRLLLIGGNSCAATCHMRHWLYAAFRLRRRQENVLDGGRLSFKRKAWLP